MVASIEREITYIIAMRRVALCPRHPPDPLADFKQNRSAWALLRTTEIVDGELEQLAA